MPAELYRHLSPIPFILLDTPPKRSDTNHQTNPRWSWLNPCSWFRRPTTTEDDDHKDARDAWRVAQDLSQHLTTLITIAVPEIFLEDFKDSVTGYNDANP